MINQEKLMEALQAKQPASLGRTFADLLKTGDVTPLPSLLVAVNGNKEDLGGVMDFIVAFFGAVKASGDDSLSRRTFFLGAGNALQTRLVRFSDEHQFAVDSMISRISFSARTVGAFEEASALLMAQGFVASMNDMGKTALITRFESPKKSFTVYLEWLSVRPTPKRPGIKERSAQLAQRLLRANASSTAVEEN